MGLSQPQTMIQTVSNFFNEKLEIVEEKQLTAGNQEVVRKIKSCSVCKVQKCNHIVREYLNNTNAAGGTSYSDMSMNQNLSAFGINEEPAK